MRISLFTGLVLTIVCVGIVCADTPPSSDSTGEKTVDQAIFEGIEKRYAAIGFQARFDQMSTLKALDITDTASGEILVKRPGMMRWMYEIPEKQIIVSDGHHLWIYLPNHNQVMVGRAPTFFGNGRGAGFLSDLTSLREHFGISREADTAAGDYHLKLIPRKENQDITSVHLIVRKRTFDIVEIITYNLYDDETRITLSDIRFKDEIDNARFKIDIPDSVDVVEMEQ